MSALQGKANEETRRAWNANAAFWDEQIGEGNDFFKILEWPAVERLLNPCPGQAILDVACGNGLTSRRLAKRGVLVTALDFSAKMIQVARQKTNPGSRIRYRLVDATDAQALKRLGRRSFDSALCNMALFDIAEVGPLFQTLPVLLKPGGTFVFSLTHPAFNNAASVHLVEEQTERGKVVTTYAIKTTRYMTPYQAHGVALLGQPRAQIYFERPLQYYFHFGFQNGFMVDGFEEMAFPPAQPQRRPAAWGGKYSEFPAVLVARMHLER
jgi:2-polyprenyl-3-methyl-5-hydroxy-6-metoxy-1,4-benzoquinol methylase